MSNDNIRILGDVEISSALTFKQDLSVFPSNPKPRTMVVKDGQPYIYAEVSTGSGYFSWLPVGAKQNSYLHSQGLESTTWTVSHGLNTTDFAYFVYDNNHVLVLANATVIDANTVQINLSEAITGTVIVFGVAHVVVPGVTAVDNVTINSIVLRDTNGVLTVNNNAVAFAGAVTSSIDAEAAARAAADIVLQNNIDTEAATARAAEGTNATAISTEAGLRAAGDTAAIATAAADATIKADAAAVSAVTTVKTYLGAVTEDIVPATDLGANLGSPTKQFHSLYVGPGTLYVNGKAVIQDNSDTMTFGTDPDQNLRLQTSGSGHLELQAASGTIDIKGTMSIESGKRIVDSAGTQVQFGDDVQMNSNKVIGLGAPLAATDAATKKYVDDLTTNDATLVRISGAQAIAGIKTFTDDLTISGNLVVSGTTTTVNSETIKLADNLIDLNSNYVAGAPTENAGIRIMRGDEAASQVRWNEATDKWEVSADSSTFSVIAVTADVTAATAAAATDATTKANAAQTAAISTAATDATNKVATEATARAAGDTTNANAIAAETTRATAAEGTLTTNLSAEATTRANADTALDGRVTTVEGQVNGKIGDLTTLATSDKLSLVAAINETDANADAASAAIAAETTRATAAEGTLTTNLSAEASARVSGDAAAISTASADATTKANAAEAAAIAAAATDATNKVATETTARNSALALKANLASPAFTGTPTAATAAAGTSTTQVATTAFVAAVQTVAAADATTKANAAQAAAITAAATDATTKANAAQAAAISTAATDATNKVATETTRATTAEALLAPKASPTFTGTVSGITKAMVGLGSVDNTADSAKPVSTAQQTALNLKANLASPAFTGTPTAATAAAGTNTTQVATTAFVAAVQVVAATDATTKANAAQSAAIAAAATDATTKANAAQAAAISTAATDATNKANAAQAAAIAAVTNGAGAAFDTLKEIQDAMATDAELASAIAAITVGNGTQTITAGAGMTGGGSFTANQTAASSVTISHADTSTVTSLTALTGAAVVSDLDFDTYGHVTGVATRTMTLANLGYTGATNANYITNNNQLTNGAGYVTSSGSVAFATNATNATTAGGLAVASARNNLANQLVRTDGNGYLQVGYINSSNGNENNNSNADRVWGTNGTDDYMRTYRTSALSVGYAASAGYATTAGSAPANGGTSSAVTITYSNNSAASYQMLWGSGTSVYGTAGVTVNPSTNVVTASGGFAGRATSASYADLAENYVADAEYVPGTVVVFGGEKEITVTDQSHDARVAGVISTNPAYLMNSDCDGLPVAFTGRVPCLVQGPVNKGDVLVTSSTPGVAQAIGDSFKPGCVIGKSLESIADNSTLLIEVVVGRF